MYYNFKYLILFDYRYGPLINYWTTRFEAKHKYFKNLSNVMGNFTNICYSLAIRHQLHQCYRSLNSSSLSKEEFEIGPGMVIYNYIDIYKKPFINVGKPTEATKATSSLFWRSTHTLTCGTLFRYIYIYIYMCV